MTHERYFTSDAHDGHNNIIKFCERPYADGHHMNVDLVSRAVRDLDTPRVLSCHAGG